MRLFTKYNRVNILATTIVLLVGGICYYFIVHFILVKQLDNDLKVEEDEIKNYIAINKSLPDPTNTKDLVIIFEPTTNPTNRKIISKRIYRKDEDELEICRLLFFSVTLSGKQYNVSISQSQEGTEDLMQLIACITLGLVLLLLFVLFVVNRFILNKLWHPFHSTLAHLKEFDVSKKRTLSLSATDTTEFIELNNAVTKMSDSVLKDYNALKTFTENASHEIQTPLAIINTKLELLVQSENFTETQMQDIQIIYGEVSRLSKLNQSLLLLTKIENNQFGETQEIDLADIITKLLNNYEELFTAKNIKVVNHIENPLFILMNETMAQVLISNLVTNAIKHNITNGSITIEIKNNIFLISNTGKSLKSNADEMFERFKKDNVETESLGLGLSIVKKICDLYNFPVHYQYNNDLHCITIAFTALPKHNN